MAISKEKKSKTSSQIPQKSWRFHLTFLLQDVKCFFLENFQKVPFTMLLWDLFKKKKNSKNLPQIYFFLKSLFQLILRENLVQIHQNSNKI
jgi:hypothetical protein